METKTKDYPNYPNESSAMLLQQALLYDLHKRHVKLPVEAELLATSKNPDNAVREFKEALMHPLEHKKLIWYLDNLSSFHVKHHEIVAKALRETNSNTIRILH